MDPYYATKRPPSSRRRRSGTALFSLVLLGCGIVFFGIVMIACAFVINYADDFESSTSGGIELAVQSGFTYSQYWAGIPFLITGVLVICSGTFQKNRGLTITTVIFSLLCVALTLFVISLDGTNWHTWNKYHRMKVYWNGQSGVDCETSSTKTCVCTAGNTLKDTIPFECDEITELSSLYGAVVGASIVVVIFCVLSVLIITKSLSWKRIRYSHHRSYYEDDFHVEPTRAPSIIDMPYAKRGEYIEPAPPTGPPYKQTVYRNYPY